MSAQKRHIIRKQLKNKDVLPGIWGVPAIGSMLKLRQNIREHLLACFLEMLKKTFNVQYLSKANIRVLRLYINSFPFVTA